MKEKLLFFLLLLLAVPVLSFSQGSEDEEEEESYKAYGKFNPIVGKIWGYTQDKNFNWEEKSQVNFFYLSYTPMRLGDYSPFFVGGFVSGSEYGQKPYHSPDSVGWQLVNKELQYGLTINIDLSEGMSPVYIDLNIGGYTNNEKFSNDNYYYKQKDKGLFTSAVISAYYDNLVLSKTLVYASYKKTFKGFSYEITAEDSTERDIWDREALNIKLEQGFNVFNNQEGWILSPKVIGGWKYRVAQDKSYYRWGVGVDIHNPERNQNIFGLQLVNEHPSDFSGGKRMEIGFIANLSAVYSFFKQEVFY